mmetsp:Transcript_43290/g.73012  ORF Transcript_43290/g.73012 Transcript_43290/m.73012 type:complete len:269 (+) Transcript_43290:2347-3153(+)
MHHPSLTDGQYSASVRHTLQFVTKQAFQFSNSVNGSTRVSHTGWQIVNGVCSGHHVHQLQLITGGHNDEVGNASEERQVEAAMMGGAVVPNKPSPVHNQAHRQLLQRHIMHHLVIASLQERGINGAERLEPLHGQTSCESNSMLLSNPDIERAAGEPLPELVNTGAPRHGSSDGHDGAVVLSQAHKGVRKNGGVSHHRGRFDLLACGDIKLGHCMVLITGRHCRLVTSTLARLDVQKHWLLAVHVQTLHDGDELVKIVTIHWANVQET